MTEHRAQEPGEPIRPPVFEQRVGDEVADELAFHIEMRTREYLAQGFSSAEARRRAEAHFPDLSGVRNTMNSLADQRIRRVRRTRFFVDLMEDIRFAHRMLWRRRAATLLAIATTALGIGAATAIYSVLDRVMFRPLPFPQPAELMAVWVRDEGFRDNSVSASWWDHVVVGQEEYRALQQAKTFRDVALWAPGGTNLTREGEPTWVARFAVTSTMLKTLRIRPLLGRGFEPSEDVLNGPRVALITSEMWRAEFGADSGVVGRAVRLGARDYTIVGVLPPGIRLDRTQPASAFWVPALQDSSDLVERHNRSYRAIARLAPGIQPTQAREESSRIFRGLAERRPERVSATVEPWQADQTRKVRGSLWILFGAGGLLLLIACVNVAVLLLGEATLRRQEMASRAAIGASQGRLARQLLTESACLAASGAIAGTFVAWALIKWMVASAPIVIPGLDEVRLDLRALQFAALAALVTGLLFGVGPALLLLRRGGGLLRLGLGQGARHANRMQHGLIAVEISLSLVLMVGCLLLGRSLRLLASVDPGFDPAHLMVIQFHGNRDLVMDEPRLRTLLGEVQREMSAVPGVSSAVVGGDVPFAAGGTNSPVRVEGVEYPEGENGPRSEQRAVFPGFFATTGIPLVAGRDFTANDTEGSEPVIIVNETGARRDWPGVSPIGKRLFWQGHWHRVIGVVGDIRSTRLDEQPEPAVYIPLAQYLYGNFAALLRMQSALYPDAELLRARIMAIDPAITVSAVDPMTHLMASSYEEQRYRAILATFFGLIAGVLAAIGVYGVIARSVAQRAREAGIRVALGATAGGVSRLMMRDAMVAISVGLVIGLPVALLTGRLLSPYLFEISAHDPIALGGAMAVLLVAGVMAATPPARRAGRTDPAVVLRGE